MRLLLISYRGTICTTRGVFVHCGTGRKLQGRARMRSIEHVIDDCRSACDPRRFVAKDPFSTGEAQVRSSLGRRRSMTPSAFVQTITKAVTRLVSSTVAGGHEFPIAALR